MEALLNKEWKVTVPEGFHVMDDAERASLNTIGAAPQWGARDPDRHMVISAAWKKLGEMFFGDDKMKPFTRATPEVDKEKILATWRDAESGDKDVAEPAIQAKNALRSHGIDVTQDDQFWVEPKAEEQV